MRVSYKISSNTSPTPKTTESRAKQRGAQKNSYSSGAMKKTTRGGASHGTMTRYSQPVCAFAAPISVGTRRIMLVSHRKPPAPPKTAATTKGSIKKRGGGGLPARSREAFDASPPPRCLKSSSTATIAAPSPRKAPAASVNDPAADRVKMTGAFPPSLPSPPTRKKSRTPRAGSNGAEEGEELSLAKVKQTIKSADEMITRLGKSSSQGIVRAQLHHAMNE